MKRIAWIFLLIAQTASAQNGTINWSAAGGSWDNGETVLPSDLNEVKTEVDACFSSADGGTFSGGILTLDSAASPSLLFSDTGGGEARLLLNGDDPGPDSILSLQADIAGTLTTFMTLDGTAVSPFDATIGKVTIDKPLTLFQGNITSSTTGDVFYMQDENVLVLWSPDDENKVRILGADASGAATTVFDSVGAGSIEIGNSDTPDITGVTINTDGGTVTADGSIQLGGTNGILTAAPSSATCAVDGDIGKIYIRSGAGLTDGQASLCFCAREGAGTESGTNGGRGWRCVYDDVPNN